MNDAQKALVSKMRAEGNGYATIAAKLNLSANTVKSFCQRNGLGGIKLPDKKVTVCEYCGEAVIQHPGRKKKRFCSDRCRNKWWNSHMDQVERKAVYECRCVRCGIAFSSYGNKNRKYCSHECYIKDRFGGEESENTRGAN